MAARLLVPRANEAKLSFTYTKVRQLAEDLHATDYTLTQSSLDQVKPYTVFLQFYSTRHKQALL